MAKMPKTKDIKIKLTPRRTPGFCFIDSPSPFGMNADFQIVLGRISKICKGRRKRLLKYRKKYRRDETP
jgi:hypothetical protein